MSDLFRCPACKEIIRVEFETCQYCSAPIDKKMAQIRAAGFQAGIDACASANTIKTANAVAPIFVVVMIYLIFNPVEWRMRIYALPIGGLAAAVGWMIKYGGLKTDDPDFPQARKSVAMSIAIWVGAALLVGCTHLYFHS